MKKTHTRLADGRELIYFDARDDAVRDAADRRPLEPTRTASEARFDPLRGEWVVIASHRQGRTYRPPADECPLCPSRNGRLSEIPADDYEVAVFENRFPSLTGDPGPETGEPPFVSAPGAGRCEVVCFTSDHDASFADLSPGRPRWSWTPGPTAPWNWPNSPASSRSSASRTAARRSASPSATRTGRSTLTRMSRRAPRR